MREAVFVKRNTPKWQDYEQSSAQDPDELTDQYIELTDDLSFARTFYPNAAVTQYLNNLATTKHRQLYANKTEDRNRFVSFWAVELPVVVRQNHQKLLYSLLFFLAAALIGAVSAANDETFVRLILGDGYVNQTLENIRKNDPMAIYKSGSQADMFLGITFNNIKVSFIAFVAGLLFSVGTVYLLFSNGVMLGAFQYFFFQKGVLLKSVLAIWIHGTLEISAIVIAGAAGIVLGNSLLFPKTYSRLVSFQRGAKDGLKMAVGLVPIFIAAGFLESFVTRLPLHPVVSFSIIAVSAGFIGWYFIIYPIKVSRQID